MNFRFLTAIVFGILLSSFAFELSAQSKGWYANQSLMRQQQMAQQQRMMQQQRIARENQRRQQQALRQQRQRQQQATRVKQQRMQQQMRQRQQAMARQRVQMQKRQRAAQLKRQQMVKSRQRSTTPKTSKSFNSSANRQQIALQQRSLRQQKLVKERAERLRKLRQKREKEENKKQSSDKQNTTLAFTAMASRVNALPKTTTKPRSAAEFKQSRVSNKSSDKSLTKQFNKQRDYVQARAKQLKQLSQKKLAQKPKNQTKLKDQFKKAAAKNFKNCNGKKCECSFHGDTGVLTSTGIIPIRDIQVGSDLVWSRNDKTGDASWQPVISHYSNRYQQQYVIEITSNQQLDSHTIISNDQHPFFVIENGLRPVSAKNGMIWSGKWVQAKNLVRGDILLRADNGTASVSSLQTKPHSFDAYNLHVANNHSYFVASELSTEDSAIWVHNHCHDVKKNSSVKPSVQVTKDHRFTNGVTLSRHAHEKMSKFGVSRRAVDTTLRKGKTYWDPKNKTIVYSLTPTSGKNVAVAVLSLIHI